jgi:hypothetical protein
VLEVSVLDGERIGSTRSYLGVMNALLVVSKDMSALLSVFLSHTCGLIYRRNREMGERVGNSMQARSASIMKFC